MLAYQLHGEKDLRLEVVDGGLVGPEEIRVRVAFNGICGTDLHYLYMDEAYAYRRPRNIGHEISGVVEEVGSQVGTVAQGDRIAVYPIIHCGECRECKDGYPVHCERFDRSISTIGCGSPIGGLAETIIVPADLAIPLPPELSLAQGALVEPLAVSYTAVDRAQIKSTDTVVILGAGPIGIGAALATQSVGASNIVVVETAAARRSAVQAVVEAAHVLNPIEDDVAKKVSELTGGKGADVVIECAGVQATFDSCIELVKKRGTVLLVGLFEAPVTFKPNLVALADLRVFGHNGSDPAAFRKVIDLMRAGEFKTDGWVAEVPWKNAVAEGFELLRRGERIKVLVKVNDLE